MVIIHAGSRVRLSCGDLGQLTEGIVREVREMPHLYSGNGTDMVYGLRFEDGYTFTIEGEPVEKFDNWFTADESCIEVLDNV